MSRPVRVGAMCLLGLIVLLAVLALLAPAIARHLIRRQLQALVASKLNANLQLQLPRLTYQPPYGVSLYDVSLTSVGNSDRQHPPELLHVDRIELELAKLPFGTGPLLIKRVFVEAPSLHLIRTSNGFFATADAPSGTPPADTAPVAAAPAASPTPAPPPTADTRRKLSDYFRLEHAALNEGQVVVEDQTRPDLPPMVWKHLNFDLKTDRQSDSTYGCHITAGNQELLQLAADASVDLDQLLVQLRHLGLQVNVDPSAAQSALSADLQQPIRQYQARGTLKLDLSATVPLQQFNDSGYELTVDFKDGACFVPQWHSGIDRLGMRLQIVNPAGSHQPIVNLQHLDAAVADSSLHLDPAHSTVQLEGTALRQWKLEATRGRLTIGRHLESLPPLLRRILEQNRLSGDLDFTLDAASTAAPQLLDPLAATLKLTPRGLTLQPSGCSSPIEGLDPVELKADHGVLTANAIRAQSDGNLLFIKTATLALPSLAQGRIDLQQIEGCLTFGPEQKYPSAFASILEPIRPIGPFFFGGAVRFDPATHAGSPDYDLLVHTTRGRLSLTDRKLPLTNIDTQIHLTPQRAVVEHFEASCLSGNASLKGQVQLSDTPSYAADVSLHDVDLKQLADYLHGPGEPPPALSGLGILSATLQGSIPADATPITAAVAGTGEFEVRGGEFWHIPVMQSIKDSLKAKDATTVGEAAGQFHVGKSRIHFDRLIASAPALGVEGSGDLGFDGRLDLKLIADALGKWSERVGDAGDGGGIAKVLDAVQKGINVATEQALYEVDVTGSVDKPKTTAVPTPFLTRQVSRLLSAASDKSRKSGLLATLRAETPASSGQSQISQKEP